MTKKVQCLALAILVLLPQPSFAFGCVWIGPTLFFQSLTSDQLQEPFVARVRIERESYSSRSRDKSFLNLDFPLHQADVRFGSGYGVDVVVTKAVRGFSIGERLKVMSIDPCSFLTGFKEGTEWYIAGDFQKGRFVASQLPGRPYHLPPSSPSGRSDEDMSRFEF